MPTQQENPADGSQMRMPAMESLPAHPPGGMMALPPLRGVLQRRTGMSNQILVFYGSYRSDRAGIRLAEYETRKLAARGANAELVDAQRVDLPMLDRMYKEYPPGEAPPAMEALAEKIRTADGNVIVAGE